MSIASLIRRAKAEVGMVDTPKADEPKGEPWPLGARVAVDLHTGRAFGRVAFELSGWVYWCVDGERATHATPTKYVTRIT